MRITAAQWRESGYPGTFTVTRNKGRGRVTRWVLRRLAHPAYAPAEGFEVVRIEPSGQMERSICEDADAACGYAGCRTWQREGEVTTP